MRASRKPMDSPSASGMKETVESAVTLRPKQDLPMPILAWVLTVDDDAGFDFRGDGIAEGDVGVVGVDAAAFLGGAAEVVAGGGVFGVWAGLVEELAGEGSLEGGSGDAELGAGVGRGGGEEGEEEEAFHGDRIRRVLLRGLVFAVADAGGGVAGVDGPGFEGAGGDGGETEDGAFGKVYTGAYGGSGADPGIGAEMHGVGEEGEGWVVQVMGGTADVGTLGDDGVGAEEDGGGVVDFCAVGDGDLVFTGEEPGGPDSGGGIDVAVGAEGGAEKAEECGSPGVERAGGRAEEEEPGDVPDEALEAAGGGEGGAQVGVGGGGGVDVVGGVVGSGLFHWGRRELSKQQEQKQIPTG